MIEFDKVTDVFAPPYHPYTGALMSAVPITNPDVKRERVILEGAIRSLTEPPKGLPLRHLLSAQGRPGDEHVQPDRRTDDGHRIAGHIPLEELRAVERFAF